VNTWGDSDKEILRELAEGNTNAEIGRHLGYAERTVSKYLVRIAELLQTKNGRRAAIVAAAFRKGIIQ